MGVPYQLIQQDKGYACAMCWTVWSFYFLHIYVGPLCLVWRICYFSSSHRQTSVWTVAAGKHYDIKPNPHLQVRQVTTIIVNSNYDSGTSNNDIALVKVEPAFQLNMYVSSVCLPTQPPRTGHYCYITGWGYIESTAILNIWLDFYFFRSKKTPLVYSNNILLHIRLFTL